MLFIYSNVVTALLNWTMLQQLVKFLQANGLVRKL